MIVLDAQAVITYFHPEPASPEVRRIVDSPSEQVAVSAVNLGEAVDHLVRVVGRPSAEVVADLVLLDIECVDVDRDAVLRAGLLRARHYHRERRRVSVADCIAATLALGQSDRASLATADFHLLDLVHAEGGEVFPLPASDGSRWEPASS